MVSASWGITARYPGYLIPCTDLKSYRPDHLIRLYIFKLIDPKSFYKVRGLCKQYSRKTDQTDQTSQGISSLGITLQPSTRLHVAKCAVIHQLTSTLDYLHVYVNLAQTTYCCFCSLKLIFTNTFIKSTFGLSFILIHIIFVG